MQHRFSSRLVAMLQNMSDVFVARFTLALEFCYWIGRQSVTGLPLVFGLKPRDEAAMLVFLFEEFT